MSGRRIAFDVLQRPVSREFLAEVKQSYRRLQSNEARNYYQVLLTLFDAGLSPDKGKEVLNAIQRTLSKSQFADVFIQRGFVHKLPFQLDFTDPLLDVVYLLVCDHPEIFDRSVAEKVEILIPKNPGKCLVLLARYGEGFRDMDNPWPMIDLLFSMRAHFQELKCVSHYISLLAFLFRKFRLFRRERGVQTWKVLCDMLQYFNDSTPLKAVYGGLAAVVDRISSPDLPIDAVKVHMHDHHDLRNQILLFLLSVPTNREADVEEDFFQMILDSAEKDVKATYVLMKMAESEKIAEYLADNPGIWMVKKFQTWLNTFCLLMVVMKHRSLRGKISECEELPSLLDMLLETEKSVVLAQTANVISKLVVNERFVKKLDQCGFFSKFVEVAKGFQTDDEHPERAERARRAVYFLFSICSEFCYFTVYRRVCHFITWEITKNGELAQIATDLAIKLCDYEDCKEKFKEKHVDRCLLKKRSDPDWNDLVEAFLIAIGHNDDEEEEAYEESN